MVFVSKATVFPWLWPWHPETQSYPRQFHLILCDHDKNQVRNESIGQVIRFCLE